MHEFALAKVNLFLHVTGRRADGYHLLDSLAVFPQIGDRLTVEPAEGLTLTVEGPFGGALASEADNLVLRAARMLASVHGVSAGARMTLVKNLPVASGIGGGSADAAATLRALRGLWRPACDTDLASIAARLGADVPVCLASRPTRMQGIGGQLVAAPILPDCGMVLINPGHAIATPDVFAARSGPFSTAACLPEQWRDAAEMARDLEGTCNDLELPALGLCPAISRVLATLRSDNDCLLARMSGSGATCFGLYASAADASAAAHRLAGNCAWWIWGGAMHGYLPDRGTAP